jgi:serine/threonine protein kinase
MSNLPNFTALGYQIIEPLGSNYQGGRLTYKALHLETQQFVAIKQFRFATQGGDWLGYKAVEREIQVLQSLEHPGIPSYRDSFDPGDGLCLVQDYKNAQPLSVPRSFDPNEIKRIALQLLEILVYLQQRIPPIIHRDLKPENVLVDEALNVYAIDFGLARIGGGDEIAASSMMAGTAGFMPPEQLLNRPLTEASDLYGLGATLICLLTGTRSLDLSHLIDSQFRIHFKSLVPHLNPEFVAWLQKMVEPEVDRRYPDAKTALEALKPLSLLCLPEIQLSPSVLEFKATQLGEKLTQAIALPPTVSVWQVVSPSDRDWIAITPVADRIEGQITVDTRSLTPDTIYERKILLRADSQPETYTLTVKIQTAPRSPILEEESVALLVGVAIASFTLTGIGLNFGVVTIIVILAVVGLLGFLGQLNKTLKNWHQLGSGTVSDLFILLAAAAVGWGFGLVAIFSHLVNRGTSKGLAFILLLCTLGLGTSIGLGAGMGFHHPLLVATVLGTGLPLVFVLLYPTLKPKKLFSLAQKSEYHPIEP